MTPTPSALPTAQRPIGVFDSGVGGLTLVRALRERLPNEQILYVGDTAHLPYGDKSPDVLQGYVRNIAHFLAHRGCKALVVACNTASAVALDAVREQAGNLPVFDVIGPAVAAALQGPHPMGTPRIGVIGTQTTVFSHVYLQRILAHEPRAHVVEKPTPLLVPLIEEGWLEHPLCDQVVQAYLSDTAFAFIDRLILGCTHYPLVQASISRFFAGQQREVRIINSSEVAAARVAAELAHLGLLAPQRPGPDVFWVTDLTASFQQIADRFFPPRVDLVRINLEAWAGSTLAQKPVLP